MNVLVVEPGYLPYEKEINGLEEMQRKTFVRFPRSWLTVLRKSTRKRKS